MPDAGDREICRCSCGKDDQGNELQCIVRAIPQLHTSPYEYDLAAERALKVDELYIELPGPFPTWISVGMLRFGNRVRGYGGYDLAPLMLAVADSLQRDHH